MGGRDNGAATEFSSTVSNSSSSGVSSGGSGAVPQNHGGATVVGNGNGGGGSSGVESGGGGGVSPVGDSGSGGSSGASYNRKTSAGERHMVKFNVEKRMLDNPKSHSTQPNYSGGTAVLYAKKRYIGHPLFYSKLFVLLVD